MTTPSGSDETANTAPHQIDTRTRSLLQQMMVLCNLTEETAEEQHLCRGSQAAATALADVPTASSVS